MGLPRTRPTAWAKMETFYSPPFLSRPSNVAARLTIFQAIFFRRRHQARRPPQAKIRPGRPAPAMGPGTVAGTVERANVRIGHAGSAGTRKSSSSMGGFLKTNGDELPL